MRHDKILAQVLREDVEGMERLRMKELMPTDMLTFPRQSLSGYLERINQGHIGAITEGTSTPQLINAKTEITRAFLVDIRSNYDWNMDT
ncbi:hypothetical protein R1flu_028023 [Riccia fluitans]|uniref:Uncharacterized protein n=1 Tax=Riccia fluitans TaxID=41844 RepID=A0ABD1XKL1_9MARC